MIGDGMFLPITYNASSNLPHSSWKLNHVLRVPNISKSLVSISKLTSDNNVFVEFHSNVCFVKDKTIGTIILREA